jgi:hypothetical protein
MATTLPAPPETVWPWLVQMGGDRGGWYSWDFLDNNGRPSADRIVSEWQSLHVGHHLPRAPGGPSRFVVAVLEAQWTLVLRGDYSENIDGIWGFHLRPAPGGSTRLVARTRNRGRPRPVMRPIGLLWEPVHFHDADTPVPEPADQSSARRLTPSRVDSVSNIVGVGWLNGGSQHSMTSREA